MFAQERSYLLAALLIVEPQGSHVAGFIALNN